MNHEKIISEKAVISLRRTLIRNFAGPVLLMLMALLVTVLVSTTFLLSSILEKQHAILDGLAGVVEQYLNETEMLVHTISDSDTYVDDEQMESFLTHLREVYPRFVAFYVLDENGVVLIEAADAPRFLGLDLSGEGFFQQNTNEAFKYSEPFVSLLTNQMVVTVVSPIEAGSTNNFLIAEMSLKLLQEKVEALRSGVSGETFILDSRGVYLAHPDISYVEQREYYTATPVFEGIHFDGHSYQIQRDGDTGKWEITSKANLDLDWTIISTQPLRTVLAPVVYELIIAAIALLSVIAGIWFNIQVSIRQISHPLSALAEKAEEISDGIYSDLEITEAPVYREVVSLERSFNKMTSAIKERDETLERRVKERTDQLAEANRDLESFMYSISHDLRAPLRAINGFSTFLTEEYREGLDNQGQFYLDRILTNSLKMDKLIEDLLDLSRLGRQSVDIVEIDITALARIVVEKLKEQSDLSEIPFTISECPTIYADKDLMEIMLTNLFSNAVKFTQKQKEPVIEFGFVTEEARVVYFVRDNGVGFNMDFVDKLYIPFQRLHGDSDFVGSGIGLAIVARIVRSHDGKIWVESEEGVGTTFYFAFDKTNK
jgi:signal transduction histidine kinase